MRLPLTLINGLVALMIATKLDSSYYHITPALVAKELKVNVKVVLKAEVQIAKALNYRLLRKTPFDYLQYYSAILQTYVCRLDDTSDLYFQ